MLVFSLLWVFFFFTKRLSWETTVGVTQTSVNLSLVTRLNRYWSSTQLSMKRDSSAKTMWCQCWRVRRRCSLAYWRRCTLWRAVRRGFLAGRLAGYPFPVVFVDRFPAYSGMEGVLPLAPQGPGKPETVPAHHVHQSTILMGNKLLRSTCRFAGCHISCLPMSFQHSPLSCSADNHTSINGPNWSCSTP